MLVTEQRYIMYFVPLGLGENIVTINSWAPFQIKYYRNGVSGVHSQRGPEGKLFRNYKRTAGSLRMTKILFFFTNFFYSIFLYYYYFQ